MITATYSLQGYRIFSNDEEIYSAGNSCFDSQVYIHPDTPGALDLPTIRDYCASTAQELATERNERFSCIEYEEPTP